MTQVVFDATTFRTLFVEFSDASLFPDATLQLYWDQAICYISDISNSIISPTCLQNLVNYLTAHLAVINTSILAGDDTYLVKSATIDKVSVSAAIPNVSDTFTWWILQTPYGKLYDALLGSLIVGGIYVGGNLGIPAFRGPTGVFNA